MEIPDNIYSWLKSTNLFSLPQSKSDLSEDLLFSFESGLAFTKLLKRLNMIKNKQDRLSTPMPEINTLKQATTPAARLYNWNILTQAFSLFNITINPDTKSLIIAGDRDMLSEILAQLYEAEKIRQSRPATPKNSGLIIDSINESKPLTDSTSCLEFLILSFCHNFSLKPKQGIGLLAQGCKYLAHIVAKGLKGDFEPVRYWLQEIYAGCEKLCELIVREKEEESLQFVMSSLKPGLLSKDIEVTSWTLRVISRLILDLNEADLGVKVWKWFEDDSIIELCLISIKKAGQEVLSSVLDLFLQVGQNHFYELFCAMLLGQCQDRLDYLDLISSFLPSITESPSLSEELFSAACVVYWIEICVEELETASSQGRLRLVSTVLLRSLIKDFYKFLDEYEGIVNNALAAVNRTCRDPNVLVQVTSVSVLFDWLQFFAEQKSSYAATVYRSLTFLLVEVYLNTSEREFILANFVELFKENQSIPVSILVEPLVKKIQVFEGPLEITDYNFLVSLSQYSRLSVKHGIQLIDVIGKIYLNDLLFSKAAGIPFTCLASRFIENEAMKDYLFVFSKHSLTLAMKTENLALAKQKKKDLTELVQQRNRVFDMVSWVVQQWQEDLNSKIKNLILTMNYAFMLQSQQNSKGLFSILALLGNVEEILKQFQEENPELFTEDKKNEEPDVSALALVPSNKSSSKVLLVKKKPFFPWDRASGDIEKAKKKKQEKDQKLREEEEKKIRALDYKKKKIKQQLDVRKLEQGLGNQSKLSLLYDEGVAQKLAQSEELVLKEFTEAESDLLESVKMILLKYSRVFKVIFQKYSGTGFARKAQNKSDFDMLAERKEKITDAEYIKIMKDHNVIPKLCSKEELRNLIRAYNQKIAKQAEQNILDYEGFKGVFCQLAYYIYSKKQFDYSHLPPVVSVKLLLDFMAEYLKNKGLSTEIWDEPDPGTGDKDVVKSLNRLLAKDPNTQIPEGYKKIAEKDFKISFKVPKCLNLPKPAKVSIEILDSILANLGIHILEPQVEYFTVYRAKGVQKEREKRIEGSRERTRPPVPAPQHPVKLSPALKFSIAQAGTVNKETILECAGVLEDILRAVQLKFTRIINKQPKPAVQELKFQQKKEQEKKEEDLRKAEEDKKRKIRQMQLQEDLNRAREEREAKLKQDELKKKAEKAAEEAKKKEITEKNNKEKQERAAMLEQWAKKKEEDSRRSKEEEKKRSEQENSKKFEEAKKRNLERLEAVMQEQKKKKMEMKEEEERKERREKESQEKKKQVGLERLRENKQKENKENDKVKDLQFLNNTQVKALLNGFDQNLDTIFRFYLTFNEKDIPQDGSLNKNMFDKFITQFELAGALPQDQISSVYHYYSKKAGSESLGFDGFKNIIAVLAYRTRDSSAPLEPGEVLRLFLNQYEVSLPVAALKGKLKKLNPGKKVKIVQKRRPGLGNSTSGIEEKKNEKIENSRNGLAEEELNQSEGSEKEKLAGESQGKEDLLDVIGNEIREKVISPGEEFMSEGLFDS